MKEMHILMRNYFSFFNGWNSEIWWDSSSRGWGKRHFHSCWEKLNWWRLLLGNLVTSIKMKIMGQRFSQSRFLVQQCLSQTLASPSGSPRPPLRTSYPPEWPWTLGDLPQPQTNLELYAFTIHGLPDGPGWSGFRELCQRVSSQIPLWEGTCLEAKSTAGATTWLYSFRK